MEALRLNKISFSYGPTKIIDDFSLSIEKGSFTTLLGSSGSGKTTLLRLISGFLECDKGEIIIDGNVMNGILPENRKIGMVFQDYALFPHLTVEQNLLYGLKIKNKNLPKNEKLKKDELDFKINSCAKNLEIENLMKRFPGELSGGQQQRVALGRSIVLEPNILLMDEPLSSLDTKLRQSVREDLKEIQQKLKITTIYVTHDQEEAFSLSDKIAVLNNGKLCQYGTSRQLYFNPSDRFTAEFVGNANFISAENGFLMVRPEWIKISKNEFSKSKKGKIISSEFLGEKIRYKIETEFGILDADTFALENSEIENGDEIYFEFAMTKKLV